MITGFIKGARGIKLFYQAWKPRGAPREKQPKAVLVFIHGMGEHSGRYQFPVDYFTRRSFPVYAMDLRGHGNSKGRRGYADDFDLFLEDINLFLKQVRKNEPGKKIFLIGHSFGGQLVLNYGVRYPSGLGGILVSSPNIRLKMKVPLYKLILAPVLSQLMPILALANEVDPSYVSRDPKVVKEYAEDTKVCKKITARLGHLVLKNQEEILELASLFCVPVLLMHAGADKICSPKGTREFYDRISIKDKSLKIYKGFYHELFNDIGKEKVFKDMEGWICERI